MAMFTRIAMSDVPPAEVVVSVVIAVASTVGIGILSAAIYRIGVLMYGKPPKLGELFRTLRGRQG
jgi:ABC-2 type transport system permease protein